MVTDNSNPQTEQHSLGKCSVCSVSSWIDKCIYIYISASATDFYGHIDWQARMVTTWTAVHGAQDY